MRARDIFRLIIAIAAVVGGLLLLIPSHYWGVLALAIKAAASIGTAAVMIRQYLQRRH